MTICVLPKKKKNIKTRIFWNMPLKVYNLIFYFSRRNIYSKVHRENIYLSNLTARVLFFLLFFIHHRGNVLIRKCYIFNTPLVISLRMKRKFTHRQRKRRKEGESVERKGGEWIAYAVDRIRGHSKISRDRCSRCCGIFFPSVPTMRADAQIHFTAR